MKKFLIFTIACAMLLSLAACAQSAKPAEPETPAQTETTDSEHVQIPNPWTECASEEEASQLAGFDLSAPDAISGSGEKSFQVMNSEDGEVIFEVDYMTGETRAAYVRKAPGTEDISGDYNDYDETETVDVGGVSVTMKGADGLMKLAVWQNGDYSYALNAAEGLSQSDMAALIAEIR